ncbi:unnamed protein product [Cladocopium goreaui]|uniref:Pyruvate, phosphate dikinase (Pyruvate, orthophosphate dikinase) n=1 Tax=Cladocopium goreaui TaxID=2562237 RepID=A0A9P1G8C8_9DINO|nr:unnamed protein product [Cladocopium goreaui]
MGRPCVAGAREVQVDYAARRMTLGDVAVLEGQVVTIDGNTGEVLLGEVPTVTPKLSKAFRTIMTWADEYRTLQVRCNAETPCDAQRAKLFGAEGIGLVRTEHMFFEGERIVAMRQMILAADEKERQSALQKLLEMQRQDFADLFEIFPSVTVRLLDAPLHEFLPSTEAGLAAVAAVGARVPASLERVKRRTAELREANPMLGHRGCRLAITYPEICQMQTRAIFEAVASLGRRQQVPTVEVMVPLVSHVEEFKILKLVVEKTVLAVQREQGMSFKYHIGAMVELPRACLQAEKLAQSAEFFSFGSNDLTQSTYGLSRDDASTFLPDYKAKGILEQDPFVTLDTEGVGELILLAVERGRKARSGMKMGICGEHGGDPGSIDFCNRIGLDYVSCSPWRAPLARLAAAQAALRADHGDGDRAKRNGTRHRCQSKRVFEAAIGSQGDGAQRIQKGDQGRPPGEVIYDPMDCQFYTWQLAIAQNLGGRRLQLLKLCPSAEESVDLNYLSGLSGRISEAALDTLLSYQDTTNDGSDLVPLTWWRKNNTLHGNHEGQREPRGTSELGPKDQRRREERARRRLEEKARKEAKVSAGYFKPSVNSYQNVGSRIRILEEPETYLDRVSRTRARALQVIRNQCKEDYPFQPKVQPAPALVQRMARSHRTLKEVREKENRSKVPSRPAWQPSTLLD